MAFASFEATDTIFKQGDMGEHFYIILSGAVDVSVHDDDTTKVTAASVLAAAKRNNCSATASVVIQHIVCVHGQCMQTVTGCHHVPGDHTSSIDARPGDTCTIVTRIVDAHSVNGQVAGASDNAACSF